jgi:membrane-bound lytic murein transglycosylase F
MLRVLPLLKKKKYYSKAVYGYARGDEPVTYVRKITSYYRVLKTMFPEDPFLEKPEKESTKNITTEKKD